jgi:hypothetical protein
MSRTRAASTGARARRMTIDPRLLDPGEKLLWSGKPNPLRYALGKSITAAIFGAFFLSISLLWIYIAAMAGSKSSNPSNAYFWLLGIPFLAVGAAMIFSPVWEFYCAIRTTYLVTNKRAIIATSGIIPHRLSVPLSRIGTIDARPYADDHGAIIFKEVIVRHSEGGETIHQDGFIAIPELSCVEKILRRAVEQASEGQSRGVPA